MTSVAEGKRYFEVTHEVFFDDLDAGGVVHNTRYLLFAERTMAALWKFVNPTSGARINLVKASAIEYFVPITQLGPVRVRVWVEKVGTTSLTLAFAIVSPDQEVDYASGTRVLVGVDLATKRPAPWSDELRAKLSAGTW